MNIEKNQFKSNIAKLTKLLIDSLNSSDKNSLLLNFKINECIYNEINEDLQDYTGTSIGDGGIKWECDYNEKNILIFDEKHIGDEKRNIEVQFNGESGDLSCYRVLAPIFINDITDCLTISYFVFVDENGKIKENQYLNIEMM